MRRMPLVATAVAVGFAVAATLSCSRPPAPAAARPDQVLQADATRHWYRGNLHTHSDSSDGDAAPAAVLDWYRAHDYDFLALTDHDVVAADAAGDGILLIRGEEISDRVGRAPVHLNVFGAEATIPKVGGRDVATTIDAVAARARQAAPAALLQLNHPNFGYAVPAEALMQQRGVGLFEVYNGHELSNNDGDGLRPGVERLWDIALAWRLDVLGLPLLYGTATDDSHKFDAASNRAGVPGRGWVMVLADRLDQAALFDSLRAGRFYASTGVTLERIVATADRLEVDVAGEPGVDYRIEFIGSRRGFDPGTGPARSGSGRAVYGSRTYSPEIGTVFARVDGTHGTYAFTPDDLYVRARITASRRHPQPGQPLQFERAWVQPQRGPAGQRPSRPQLPPPAAVAMARYEGATSRFARLAAPAAATLLAGRSDGCALDRIADGKGRGGDVLARDGRGLFAGWLADQASQRVPDSLSVVLAGDSHWIAEGGVSRARPDLAQARGVPAFEAGGFGVDFAMDKVPAGEYRVWLVAYYDGRALACDSGKTVQVVDTAAR